MTKDIDKNTLLWYIISMIDGYYTTEEVCNRRNPPENRRNVTNWAEKNGVKYIGDGRRKIYLYTESDIEKFFNRRGKGRPRKDGK